MPVVRRQIQLLLTAAGYRDWDVGVRFTGDKLVRTLNAQYRNKDKSTDILSFRNCDPVEPGVMPEPTTQDSKDLGDIYISIKYVSEWCEKRNVDIHDRLPVLYAHGICHLLGYDHENDQEYRTMKQKENRMLRKMKKWQAVLDGQAPSK
ncbi:hypothetical protein BGX31_005219 [Mortierella sp. GBA43]|nr:hypothetical protein BGX31_005219 [Mortierella sp. GBA43]